MQFCRNLDIWMPGIKWNFLVAIVRVCMGVSSWIEGIKARKNLVASEGNVPVLFGALIPVLTTAQCHHSRPFLLLKHEFTPECCHFGSWVWIITTALPNSSFRMLLKSWKLHLPVISDQYAANKVLSGIKLVLFQSQSERSCSGV